MNEQNKDSSNRIPSQLEEKFDKILTPFQEFIKDHATAGVLLIIFTLAALVIANSPYSGNYASLINSHIGVFVNDISFGMSLHHWVNDGLMAIFFFVLGLEIKREIIAGELQQRKKLLPVLFAAIGGMLVPALIFYVFNYNSPYIHSWGIPMATDTAFAISILVLLGRRVPAGLIAFLTALAIIDDLGAILVIAIFYTEQLNLIYLSLAAGFFLLLVGCNSIGCRHPTIYLIGGGLVWLAMLGSGVHATVAGILVALAVPARPKLGADWFIKTARKLINKFEYIERASSRSILGEAKQHAVVENLQDSAAKASTPLRRWERSLEYPVALLVIPVFALVNAGVPVNYDAFIQLWNQPLSLGIIFGLVVGKAIGISSFCWLAVKLRLGRLPEQVSMKQVVGISLLGGMGFTMSIFIANLGLTNQPETLIVAKSAILVASLIAGVCGYLWLRGLNTKADWQAAL